jgi:hypothetical protein
MRTDPGPIPLADLRASGVLLEINRRVLHPVGLQLYNVGTGYHLDRMNPTGDGGCTYHATDEQGAKAAAFRTLESAEHMARFRKFGFIVQPLPGEPPRTVAPYDSDC